MASCQRGDAWLVTTEASTSWGRGGYYAWEEDDDGGWRGGVKQLGLSTSRVDWVIREWAASCLVVTEIVFLHMPQNIFCSQTFVNEHNMSRYTSRCFLIYFFRYSEICFSGVGASTLLHA
jgi:hypothetical protein